MEVVIGVSSWVRPLSMLWGGSGGVPQIPIWVGWPAAGFCDQVVQLDELPGQAWLLAIFHSQLELQPGLCNYLLVIRVSLCSLAEQYH